MTHSGATESPRGATRLVVHPPDAWPRLSEAWRTLSDRSSQSSFFLSADWVDAWMAAFAGILKPDILLFQSGDAVVGACLLVRRREWVGPIPVTKLYLNMAGEDEFEDTTIEFNDVLCLGEWRAAVAARLAAHLEALRWDEFSARGLSGDAEAAMRQWPCFASATASRIERSSHYVDLAAARHGSPAFDEAIGPRSRKNVRRYINLYRTSGEVRTEAAADAGRALVMLDELIALHQSTWARRGRPGAFASPRIVELHRGLIRRAFASGLIQVLRVTAGDAVVGIAYNFVFRGKVYAYQQGLRYEEDRRLHPGFVTTAGAVQYCMDHGLDEYDHLAGHHIDKKAISTGSRPLVWASWRRRTLATRAVGVLRRARGAASGRVPLPGAADEEDG